jgi:SAM-dependent methyltransferase
MAKLDCIVCGARGHEITINNLPMLICDSCGLFWRASFDLPENFYETREFETEKRGKIEARYANSIGRIETLRRYADVNNLCDVGCGEGIFLKALNDLGYKNVFGLEPSLEARDFAVLNNLKIVAGGIENLSESFFTKNDVHTVTIFHVVEHLKDPYASLKLIYDNLGKGDKLAIETPDMDSYALKKSNYKNELINPEHLHYFNKTNLKKLLEKSGFTVIASGNRDFNEKNMSIRESLSRLGFINVSPDKKDSGAKYGEASLGVKDGNDSIFRTIVRRTLSSVVGFLGRGNYLWIVAQK